MFTSVEEVQSQKTGNGERESSGGDTGGAGIQGWMTEMVSRKSGDKGGNTRQRAEGMVTMMGDGYGSVKLRGRCQNKIAGAVNCESWEPQGKIRRI